MDSRLQTMAATHVPGKISRRVFFERLIGVLGTYAAAHSCLETSGVATSLPPSPDSAAASVESTAVKYPGEGITMEGFLSRPKEGGPFPAIIVVDENHGLNDRTRDAARKLASQGYVTLAVDLLSRQGGTASFQTLDAAMSACQKLGADEVIRDLNASYHYLNKNAAVQADTISVRSACWCVGRQKSEAKCS